MTSVDAPGSPTFTGYVRDITDRRQADEQKARLAALVTNSADAILSKTLDGVITSWNAAAEHMLGYISSEAIGKHIRMLVPEDRHSEEDEILARLRAGDRIQHYETVRLTKDGQPIDVSLSISPIRDTRGVVLGAAKIMRDIRDRKAMEAERERILADEQTARRAAEEANREKDNFLANLGVKAK